MQAGQSPQDGTIDTTTASPAFSRETRGPVCVTTPAASWPGTRGNGASVRLPSMALRSLAHRPLAATFTSTSPSRGGARSTSPICSFWPTPPSTAAVIFTGRSSCRGGSQGGHAALGVGEPFGPDVHAPPRAGRNRDHPVLGDEAGIKKAPLPGIIGLGLDRELHIGPG